MLDTSWTKSQAEEEEEEAAGFQTLTSNEHLLNTLICQRRFASAEWEELWMFTLGTLNLSGLNKELDLKPCC